MAQIQGSVIELEHMDNSVLKAAQEVFNLLDDLSDGDPNIAQAILQVVQTIGQVKVYREQMSKAQFGAPPSGF